MRNGKAGVDNPAEKRVSGVTVHDQGEVFEVRWRAFSYYDLGCFAGCILSGAFSAAALQSDSDQRGIVAGGSALVLSLYLGLHGVYALLQSWHFVFSNNECRIHRSPLSWRIWSATNDAMLALKVERLHEGRRNHYGVSISIAADNRPLLITFEHDQHDAATELVGTLLTVAESMLNQRARIN